MAIATEDSAALFADIVASTPLNCNFPLYEADEVEVVYGSQALIAVYPTDYTVQLNEAEDFEDFTITPTASLLTKINALIAAPPTEEAETNFVVVRRKLDYLTSVEPETVRYTPFLSKEIDRIHMKLIQLAERVARSLGLPANVVGELTDNYTISAPVEGKAPVWRGNKLVAEIDAANIASAEDFALTAEGHADDALGYAVDAANSKDAAQAAAAGMRWRPSVRAATTVVLPSCTYANGTGGVGATLTGNANGALAAQDGVTLIAANRLLVKDQVASLQNGVYDVTQAGSAGTPFILTRATDADSWAELVSQVVVAEEGTTQKDLAYICTANQGGTIGTDIVTWASLNPPLADGSVSYAKCDTGVKASLDKADSSVQTANGQILQVLSTTKTDTFSHGTATFTDVTGLSQAITPTDNTNKVLVTATISVGVNMATDNAGLIKLLRDSTEIGNGASDGSNRVECMASVTPLNTNAIQTVTITYLDSPASASSVTYKIQVAASNGGDVYVNRSHTDTDATSIARCSSTITVMEVRA